MKLDFAMMITGLVASSVLIATFYLEGLDLTVPVVAWVTAVAMLVLRRFEPAYA